MGNDAETLLNRIGDLPPLPAIALRVMRAADDPQTSAMDLAQILQTDQALTAKLIHISNSAYYGFARRVGTVREAVVLLGFKQVRQVAVGLSLMSMFRTTRVSSDRFNLDLFWGHSVAVAVAAEALAKNARVVRPEDAFTAGILHDIGRLVLRHVMPGEFEEAVRMACETGMPLGLAELETTGFAHDEIGQALSERWQFPSHLVEAVGRHHDQRLTPENDGIPGVVAQANRLALHYGLYCGYDIVDGVAGDPGRVPHELQRAEAACGGIDRVLKRAFTFMELASGAPKQRYADAA